jgi:hypothetical protein
VKSGLGKLRRAAGTVAEGARVRVGLSRGRVWRDTPPPLTTSPASTAMDEEVVVDDVFSSGHLWRQSTLFAGSDAYTSALFAPLQLDSQSVACLRPGRVGQN